ncbi:histidine kinase dimerization/phosphoacceptor domain -containing protein [Chelativorans sp. AA-79]|uniref:sensor histidine kinase n=1 Tax=Chelativorans sp. AA-79 TaxID=3028735 RepID=UPI0023F688E6|nr:histidine kinase dimerization/phosphoacceptor domain -containing protein [Chelativorans sp. AA-79]WEX11627.1 histidine kinase dimerization/phosphoacceptor domain -containing protein [Chelativorans sp. AA-79]
MASGSSGNDDIVPERATVAEELAYRLRQQQISAEYALFALKTHDVQALLQQASKLCAQGLQSKLCKVMEYIPEEHQFIVRAGVGWKPGVVGQVKTGADAESPTGYAFMTGLSIISNHLQGESRFRTPRILADHGVKRAINTLIQCSGERFGVLEVDSPINGRFTEADLVFVTGMANLLGVALERQRVEETLKRKEELLQQALRHEEMLSREINHRVKNSLAIVSGLLNAQGRTISDPHLRQALADAEARVHAIGRIHELLGRKKGVESVSLPVFLGDLCAYLQASAPGHDLVLDVAPVMLATGQAISLGLLVNELITNALKHAYADGSGPVLVKVAREGGMLRLEVADRGVGMPAEGAPLKGHGLGRKVIASLSAHLGGTAEWRDANPGTMFVLTFRPDQVSADE